MPLYILTRHAGTTLNAEGRINGDPAVAVPLTAEGRAQAKALGVELANLPFDLCIHTRFERTRATAELALAGRDVPLREEPLLDDIDVGELEGRTIAEYREWKTHNDRTVRFPGGESLDEAARRYATGFRKLLALPASSVLVVTHEIPVRYALNAAAGSDDLDGPVHQLPNATPYLFEADALARAARHIDELVGRAP